MPAEVVTLTCSATGDRARVLVSQGFNCFELAVNVAGKIVDALWALPDFSSGQLRPSSSGIPLLFPFPGRIPGTSFTFNGKTYELEPSDKFGNAIHGFCHSRPWRLIAQQDDCVTGEFHASQVDPTLAKRWPSDFRVTATYALGAGVLVGTYKFENVGDEPLPCGFGAHPYFRVPLVKGSSAADCIVQLPVTKQWELVDMLPTGRLLDWPEAEAYAAGVPFGPLRLDDAFAGLQSSGPMGSASIADPAGPKLSIAWDKSFRELIVFTPPHGEALCIEPYTCVPGAIGLQEKGIDAGLRVLAPGESFSSRIEFRVR
jgi:aldose 1-epimerase